MIKNKNIKLNKNELNIINKTTSIIYFNKSIKINKSLKKLLIIHKGNSFVKIITNRYFSGFYLGEFIFTRKFFYYPKTLKKKKHIRR